MKDKLLGILFVFILPLQIAVKAIAPECENCACCAGNVCKDTYLFKDIEVKDFCIYGCIAGYGGRRCYNKCPDDCITCDHVFLKNCATCAVGEFLNNTKRCVDCPERCVTCTSDTQCQECHHNFGGNQCERCVNGKYGMTCTQNCSDNCKDRLCEQEHGTCLNCYPGFKGDSCTFCDNGFYKQDCSAECKSSFCLDNQCQRNTGLCVACPDGRYGAFCNLTCSPGCILQKCVLETGECIHGCDYPYSGDKCCVNNTNCEVCVDGISCSTCVSGYYGVSCENACPNKCSKSCDMTGQCTDQQAGDNSGVIIGSAVGGLCFIGLMIGGLVMCIRRFRKPKSPAGVETIEASTFKGDYKTEDNVAFEIPAENYNYENTDVYDSI